MNLRIRKYNWHSAPPQIRGIRQRVFVEEQNVPPELEWDVTDQSSEHFLVVVDGNKAAATARLYGIPGATGFIGRMAVLPQYRGKQIGQALLQHLICQGAVHYSQLQLSAQQHAVEFYQRAGFHLCSDQYDDAGIAHFDMRCLAPSVLAEDLAAEPAEKRPGIRKYPMNLGDDSRSWLFERPQQLVELMHSLAGQARQRLWLYDNTLDFDLYDQPRFCELVSRMARRHRLSDVRLLIQDDKALTQRRHGLVELMRRLPSRIELRLLSDATPPEKEPFLLADRQGVLYRHEFGGSQGFANFSDGGRVKSLEERFLQMWNASQRSMELRVLSL
ncbi:GNAT family N-acetyltransferase [Marinobacter sp. ELB17]|uniref:GNAT family N-acetyltransferase n=1 Tax=Marinobacter sp. ELB17 TaxID=270374 RepID=UPI0000F39D35|nr:GNAT family N-acetyltransferase [Marinobacter sp. ELB17]EAZ98842.1 acyltransferase-like protein [Marinobacter sp. ELB17]